MSHTVLVVGHRNPDNDSISSAVAYAHLKNEIAARKANGEEPQYIYVPARLGPLPPESEWVLAQAGFEAPKIIANLFARVADSMTKNPISVPYDATIMEAGRLLRQHNVRSLVVEDKDGLYLGLVTTRMIAERYIEATDILTSPEGNEMMVAANLISSLGQSVSDITETDVLELNEEDLLSEAVDSLMASSLREAVVIDDNRRCVGIMTRSDINPRPHRKVILVDHNERIQAAAGIEDANVLEIVDHHRLGDITTATPIMFLNMPVGSTATIVAMEYERNQVEISQSIAKVILSALLTDTVVLKSPTTTDIDRQYAEHLSKIAGVEILDFGVQLFRNRGGEESASVEDLVGRDAKEFMHGDEKIYIAQYETVDLDAVLKREEEIRTHLRRLVADCHYEFALFMVTDILAEGSQFIGEGNCYLVNRVFNIDCADKGGTWMPGVLSRKKQVAAKILGA